MKADILTQLTVDWLSKQYPDATVVTEMSVADWGGARLDVAAITDEEIIGVEIKGEGDSPSRLELQGLKYGQVARKMWLLVTPDGTLKDRCAKKKPTGWGMLRIHNGVVDLQYKCTNSQQFNPWAMCGTLWRDELYDLARLNGVKVTGRTTVGPLTDAVVSQMSVIKLHDAMIDQLRRRVWRKPVIELRGIKNPNLGLFANQVKN